MAVLNATERSRIVAQFMRDIRESFGITKPQLAAAVDGLDDYFDANASSINQAIPAAARGALTVQQKATLIGYVAFRRAGKLRAEEDG